ncbi:MAG: hypothetical protein ACI9K3_001556, partial [Halovenus sp.]
RVVVLLEEVVAFVVDLEPDTGHSRDSRQSARSSSTVTW